MTIQMAIITRIGQLPAVTALVGSRVYLDHLPQTARFPAIRVQKIGVEFQGAHLRGVQGTRRSRIQVDIFASKTETTDPAALAQQISDLLHEPGDGSALNGWRGTVGSPALTVLAVLPAGDREDYEAEELRQYRCIRDYHVWWRY